MHRFFSSNTPLDPPLIEVTDTKEIHHLKNVLRLKMQDQICLFNAEGEEIVGTILSIEKNRIEIRNDYQVPSTSIDSQKIVLACAIPKKSKFELIIEKCTELGVSEIIPMITKRTEFTVNEERRENKNLRFRTVAINASKQSGRKTIPQIHPVSTFSQILTTLKKEDAHFIPCLLEPRIHLGTALKQTSKDQKIMFLIGPEGDFTSEEIQQAVDHGCQPVSLGTNVLKVDTAALSVVAFTQLFFS